VDLTDLLRAAVLADGRPLSNIRADARVEHRSMQRFMAGSGLNTTTAGRLMKVLGLVVVPATKRGAQARRV
jgi:hypothetical protein